MHGLTEDQIGQIHPMDHHEKMRLRNASFRATHKYPGPVGKLLAKEIMAWEEFGYRLGGHKLIMEIVNEILKEESDPPTVAERLGG